MAEQRSHLADHRQPGRGLQPVLAGARNFFNAALLAHIKNRAHPAGVLAYGIDQRRFHDQHRKPRAVATHEHGLMAAVRHIVAGQPNLLALLVGARQLRRPVGRRKTLVEQILGIDADHFAERRVHVGDAALQVARTQPGQHRVFHGLAKSQRLAEVVLHLQTPAHVTSEQKNHQQQSQRHGTDERRQHVGKQCRRCQAAFHAQHQGVARQIEQLLGNKNAAAGCWRAVNGQTRAVRFGERQADAPRQRLAHQLGQNILQAVGGHAVARHAARRHNGRAQVEQLQAQAVGLRHKVAAGVGRARQAPRGTAGQAHVGLHVAAAEHREHRFAVGGFGNMQHVKRFAAPLQPHQFPVVPQQLGSRRTPRVRSHFMGVHGLKALDVAHQRRAHVHHGIGRALFEPALHQP